VRVRTIEGCYIYLIRYSYRRVNIEGKDEEGKGHFISISELLAQR